MNWFGLGLVVETCILRGMSLKIGFIFRDRPPLRGFFVNEYIFRGGGF
jgi:hypothetical protein